MTPLIVLTNDDGIRSPGLRAAVEAIVDLGELLIVAPREQQSSAGRAFYGEGDAVRVPYGAKGKRLRAYAVPTSPAVTVRHAVMLIADRKPDLVISGINYGENIGNGLTISGTVGAAIEASSLGIPAMAVSVSTELKYHRTHSRTIDFSVAAQYTRRFARRILKQGMPAGADVLNINVPSGATLRTPWRWTRVSRQSYFQSTFVEADGIKRFTGYASNVDRSLLEPDSDIYAILVDRVVSVTPVTFDLTARMQKAELAHWRGK